MYSLLNKLFSTWTKLVLLSNIRAENSGININDTAIKLDEYKKAGINLNISEAEFDEKIENHLFCKVLGMPNLIMNVLNSVIASGSLLLRFGQS